MINLHHSVVAVTYTQYYCTSDPETDQSTKPMQSYLLLMLLSSAAMYYIDNCCNSLRLLPKNKLLLR